MQRQRAETQMRREVLEIPAAVAQDWPDLRAALGASGSVYCLGRGPAWAVSNEAVLKFKETCQIHAESYSSAEVLHGPVSIVDPGFPVLALAAQDAAEAPLCAVADDLARRGGDGLCQLQPGQSGARPAGDPHRPSAERPDCADRQLLRDGRAVGG
ncbi:SIS domain-containing protein [Candidatus Halocynthiibacter alkanivorans]|uniref:SIS domain-containing protein n=1 Tax=Candidatus Halocynthiibacter alkanivorans TaxID=2267619 RepID=UPI003AF40A9A